MNKQQLLRYAYISYDQASEVFKSHVPVCLIWALFFLMFPEIDLFVSGLYFKPAVLGLPEMQSGFWLRYHAGLQFSYELVDWLGRLALIFSIVIAIRYFILQKSRAFYATVMLFALIAGPILAVNGLVKENWGRARPKVIEQFGGDKDFSSAWVMTNQCQHNCAFTSGHAAAGFALSLGYLVSRRKAWLFSGIALGGLIGLTRIMNGAHFFSDVFFSYYIVMIAGSVTTMILSLAILQPYAYSGRLKLRNPFNFLAA